MYQERLYRAKIPHVTQEMKTTFQTQLKKLSRVRASINPCKCQGYATVSIKFLPGFDSHIQCPKSVNCTDFSTRQLIYYNRS
jgi:hypothetical protein